MKDLKYIQQFIFGSASYYLGDGVDDKAILTINYKDNKYLVEYKGKIINRDFRLEINKIAETLLKRKSGINRAKEIKL